MLKLIKDITRALWVAVTGRGKMAVVIGVENKAGRCINAVRYSNSPTDEFILALLEGTTKVVKEDAV